MAKGEHIMSQKTLEKVLEHLLNHEQEAAGDLLHNYFVEKGRSIYESMIQTDEQVEEEISADPVADFEEEVIADESEIENEEMFSEEEGDMDSEEAAAELDAGAADAEAAAGEEAPADDAAANVQDAMMDVEDAISALKAEFDKLVASGGEDKEADMPTEESLGEAVEMSKVANPDNGDKADNKHSPVSSGAKVSDNGAGAVDFGKGNEAGGKVAAPKVDPNSPATTEPDLKAAVKPSLNDGSDKTAKSPVPKA